MSRSLQSPACRPLAQTGARSREECKRAPASDEAFPHETNWHRPNANSIGKIESPCLGCDDWNNFNESLKNSEHPVDPRFQQADAPRVIHIAA